ncbi:MAG: hypothetical protein M1830_008734 [Pleopsidium flavum]|nr:MAG: hypothetical protein M1830_008734 [Pleopsidium flavum]
MAMRQTSTQDETVLVEDLLRNCQGLLKELEDFRTFLVQQKKDRTVEIRQFKNSVQSELKSLAKLSNADPTADRTIHTLRSSNFPFYNAVWEAAKRSTGLLAFNKRFYWDLHPSSRIKGNGKLRRRSALVDIVTQNGEEWVKVSTVTETRLLFEKAKAGWEGADSSSESAGDGTRKVNGIDHADGLSEDSDGDDGIGLVKLAEELERASMTVRVKYKHPKVRFVLPKIVEGKVPEVDDILDGIRETGATVQCANDLDVTNGIPTSSIETDNTKGTESSTSTTVTGSPAPPTDPTHLSTTFYHLLINDFATFTPTLNIDCTILLALVSDLSHARIHPEPWFHRAIKRQIELEAKDQLLPNSLWPAMGGRELVCTVEAAKRMREIVGLIGTPAEKVRTGLLMGDDGGGKTSGELVREFGEVSEYQVPEDWRLPIRVVAGDVDLGGLPAVAEKVAEQITAINRSVFLYGWANGITTISSNRTVTRLIETIVEEHRTSEDDRGPDIWLCPTARSLVGKEKGRKD